VNRYQASEQHQIKQHSSQEANITARLAVQTGGIMFLIWNPYPSVSPRPTGIQNQKCPPHPLLQ
jgi:hypothetical protein